MNRMRLFGRESLKQLKCAVKSSGWLTLKGSDSQNILTCLLYLGQTLQGLNSYIMLL